METSCRILSEWWCRQSPLDANNDATHSRKCTKERLQTKRSGPARAQTFPQQLPLLLPIHTREDVIKKKRNSINDQNGFLMLS